MSAPTPIIDVSFTPPKAVSTKILDRFDKLLTNCKDYHLPICTFVFCVGSILQWWHHMDRDFIAYTVVVLGAITGHAFSPSQRDQPDDPH